MKKLSVIVLCLLVFLASAIAQNAFSIIPKDGPLYKESIADPYGFISKLHLQYAVDSNLRPTKIRSSVLVFDKLGNYVDTQYIDIPYEYGDETGYNTYTHMRTALSVGLARYRIEKTDSLPSFDFELELGGSLNTLFHVFYSSASLGFDGSWMICPTVRIADRFTIRAGLHHFSGHYGDEILDKYYDNNMIDFSPDSTTGLSGKINGAFDGKSDEYDYYLGRLMEYVRDNSFITGFAYDSPFGLRAYGEFEMPFHRVWLRPFADTPVGYKTIPGKELMDSVGDGEDFSQEQIAAERAAKTGTGYHAFRAHFGVEYFYSLSETKTAFVSADVQLHQDGQTKHTIGQYKPSNPWEYELTIDVGLKLGEVVPGKNMTIDLEWHDGRTSTTDFYYQRCKTVSLGFSIM
ncbi:MAG: hypothetical protein MJ057_06545 [Sphaerochaetaceae bacterium]|nr:hypothetical protein [Sphaerochaetaceae bacterium]